MLQNLYKAVILSFIGILFLPQSRTFRMGHHNRYKIYQISAVKFFQPTCLLL